MATSSLIRAALPSESELQSFASAAAQLLIDRQARIQGNAYRQTSRRRRHPALRPPRLRSGRRSPPHRLAADRATPATDRAPLRIGVRVRLDDRARRQFIDGSERCGQVARCRAHGRRDELRPAPARPSGGFAGLRWTSAVALPSRARTAPLRNDRAPVGDSFGRLRRASAPTSASACDTCMARLRYSSISDFLADDEMRRDLAAILQRCTALHLMQMSDREETRLSVGTETVDLEDVETGERMPWHPASARAQLAARERERHDGAVAQLLPAQQRGVQRVGHHATVAASPAAAPGSGALQLLSWGSPLWLFGLALLPLIRWLHRGGRHRRVSAGVALEALARVGREPRRRGKAPTARPGVAPTRAAGRAALHRAGRAAMARAAPQHHSVDR